MMTSALLLSVSLAGQMLTLGEAVSTAEANQPRLQESHALTEASEARVAEARAPLLPQIVASARYRRTTGNRVLRAGTDPRLLALQPPPDSLLYNFFTFEVVGTQLIYDFGQTPSRLSSAAVGAEAQRDSERAAHLDVIGEARLAFFLALAQKQLVLVAKATRDNQKRHLDQVEQLVLIKTRPEIDLAQARLEVANAEVGVIEAVNAYDSAKADLNQAMGVERATDYDVDETTLPGVMGEDGPLEPLVEEALRRRPEFASLTHQAQAADALASAAQGAYGPTLSASAGASESGTELARLRYNYFGLVTLSWTLFEGMATPARVREARANAVAVRAQAASLRQAVRLDIQRAVLAVHAAESVLLASADALKNADERQQLAKGRYEAGVGNSIELGDAIVARAQAAAQQVQARFLLCAARARLLRALGRA